jgi:heme A synthase
MNIFREVGGELFKMFVGDAGLTVGILMVVSLTGLLTGLNAVPLPIAGALLFLGCVVVLVASVALAGRRYRNRKSTTLN